MEINIIDRAGTALASGRVHSWLRAPFSTSITRLQPAARLSAPPASSAIPSFFGPAYDLEAPVCAADDRADDAVVLGMAADHKFSTRLGPGSAPPV